jgi:hypothetical protein
VRFAKSTSVDQIINTHLTNQHTNKHPNCAFFLCSLPMSSDHKHTPSNQHTNKHQKNLYSPCL